MREIREVYDSSGEELRLALYRQRNGFRSFVMINKESFEMLAGLRNDLGACGYAVLHKLLGGIDYGNLVRANLSDIAKSIGSDRHQVSKVIKKLVALELIKEVGKSGRSKIYSVSPELCWKGSPVHHKKAIWQSRNDKLNKLMSGEDDA